MTRYIRPVLSASALFVLNQCREQRGAAAVPAEAPAAKKQRTENKMGAAGRPPLVPNSKKAAQVARKKSEAVAARAGPAGPSPGRTSTRPAAVAANNKIHSMSPGGRK